MMEEMLGVEGLHKVFRLRRTSIYAVNGVSFALRGGEALGLVGESGCGKSTVARCILRLMAPTQGTIRFKGVDISTIDEASLRPMRKKLQMVFQDPSTSLNPRMTVRQALVEPLRLFHVGNPAEIEARLQSMLGMVELERGHLKRYPHQLSGGQQQRVAVARAMITEPDCVVLDEPTASQDAPVKVQLLGLLGELQEKLGVAYLFISHDLSTVRSLCHRVLVMYLGKIVEEGPAGRVFDNPLHPYTRALISAIPVPDPKRNREVLRLPGETQSLTRLIPACSLQDRCPFVRKECREQDPPLRILNADHRVACFHAFEQARAGDHGAQAV